MARRYKPLPAGAIVVMQIFGTTAQVISDDGAGLVYVLERTRAYDYQTHKARSQIRPATAAETDAHRQRVAQYALARVAAQQQMADTRSAAEVLASQVDGQRATWAGGIPAG